MTWLHWCNFHPWSTVGCMAATDPVSTDAIPATDPRINFAVFDAKCAERGATNDVARARLAGVNRTTIWRWRKGLYSPDFKVATQIAHRFGISLDELTGRAA